MSVNFQTTSKGSVIAKLDGVLDGELGQNLVTEVERRWPQKSVPLLVDGAGLSDVEAEGLIQLIVLQNRICQGKEQLLLLGFKNSVWLRVQKLMPVKDCFELMPSLEMAEQSLQPPPSFAPVPAFPQFEENERHEEKEERHDYVPSSQLTDKDDEDDAASSAYKDHVRERIRSRQDRNGPPSGRSDNVRRKPERGGYFLLWPCIVLAVAILGGGAWWWTHNGHQAPEVSASALEIRAQEEQGEQINEVMVTVKHGILACDPPLPKGFYFDAPRVLGDPNVYYLRGGADKGATSAQVQLYAIGENNEPSNRITLAFQIVPKEISWQPEALDSLGLQVSKPISGDSIFVTGVANLTPVGSLPDGLTVEKQPRSDKDWHLVGTPTKAGRFTLKFEVQRGSGGASEQKQFDVSIAPSPERPPGPAPTPTPGPAPDHKVVVEDSGAKMRDFFLARFRTLPSSTYNEKERKDLRSLVRLLTEAHLVCRVQFGSGKSDVSKQELQRIEKALQAPENAALVKEKMDSHKKADGPRWQILVVGYASKSGNLNDNVHLSQDRAAAVNDVLKAILGDRADLCGEYGPTDVIDLQTAANNQAVEVYAAKLQIEPGMSYLVDMFKDNFNRHHGRH